MCRLMVASKIGWEGRIHAQWGKGSSGEAPPVVGATHCGLRLIKAVDERGGGLAAVPSLDNASSSRGMSATG